MTKPNLNCYVQAWLAATERRQLHRMRMWDPDSVVLHTAKKIESESVEPCRCVMTPVSPRGICALDSRDL